MDGNRRWAQDRGLPTLEGHRRGYEKFRELMNWIRESGVRNLIIYAFSTENWGRSAGEKTYLMQLFRTGIRERMAELEREKVRVRFIGEREKFPPDIQEQMKEIEEKSSKFTEATLGIALSYGGRAEIVEAIRHMRPEELTALTEESFSQRLWTAGIPDPELIIRTGGAHRLSNFLPWQSVYAELYFTDVYWPDFDKKEFDQALQFFAASKRNFGK